MKHAGYLGLLVLTLGLLFMNPIIASEWVCFKGSPERTGSAQASAPDTCCLLWETDTESELYASPLVKQERVYLVALDKLYCLNLGSGDCLWTSHVPGFRSTPFVTEDKIIVATNRGISALSTGDGMPLWEYTVSGRFRPGYPLEDYIVSSPILSEERVVVGTMPYYYQWVDPYAGPPDEEHLICLDGSTGGEIWYVEKSSAFLSSPCVAHGKIFAALTEMLCIDLETGNVLWDSEETYPLDLDSSAKERYVFSYSTPCLYHGILVGGSASRGLSSGGGFMEWQKIVFIDQYTGNILWEWAEEGFLASSPAVHNGNIYLYSLDGMVRCLSFLDGKELWKTRISEPIEYETAYFKLWPSPTVADGKVYIGSIEGVINCLDSETGGVLWTYQTGGEIRSAPAVVDGKVLVSSTDGKLYCFGIDPDTYFSKAQEYLEEGEIEKAQQFLVKAKEYAKPEEEITRIENLLEIANEKMPKYTERMEKIEEAESLMDEADKIMWDKRFEKAHDLYSKACTIFQEVDDEFGEAFCMERIEYITQRMPEETTEIPYYLGILVLCGIIAYLLIARVKKRNSE
ncbi:MAG: PQQ-binding-like beta-propeller repeat protein [Theionarchaea archaeon]|nr:PQQ-binding-like beta-propeller repeat protein [Theionarchaea archaeon]